MYWYHWIAVYLILIGAGIFTIIPDKPWWLWLVILGCIGAGIIMGIILPHKEDKYAKRAE